MEKAPPLQPWTIPRMSETTSKASILHMSSSWDCDKKIPKSLYINQDTISLTASSWRQHMEDGRCLGELWCSKLNVFWREFYPYSLLRCAVVLETKEQIWTEQMPQEHICKSHSKHSVFLCMKSSYKRDNSDKIYYYLEAPYWPSISFKWRFLQFYVSLLRLAMSCQLGMQRHRQLTA